MYPKVVCTTQRGDGERDSAELFDGKTFLVAKVKLSRSGSDVVRGLTELGRSCGGFHSLASVGKEIDSNSLWMLRVGY